MSNQSDKALKGWELAQELFVNSNNFDFTREDLGKWDKNTLFIQLEMAYNFEWDKGKGEWVVCEGSEK